MMKRLLTLLSVTWLLNSCTSQPQATVETINCPSPPKSPPSFQLQGEQDFYNNLQSVQTIATDDTITFQTRRYDLTFCRPNQTWIVQEGTYIPSEKPPKDYEAALKRLGDPPYQTLELDGKSYQYRVLLDPNPFPNFKTEPRQVILELIKPEETDPQRQTLYTLDQVKSQKTGLQLGIPTITASLIYNNHLYWTIAPEQGEGNGGIATIASYDPKTDKITLIQPQELVSQQINDLAITGEPDQPIFWMATQMSGEGNPYLPGMGLVAYRPTSKDLKTYHLRNSPLVGSIPRELNLDGQFLWVGTGNGICQVKWKTIETSDSWQCWRFSLQAELPETGVEVYPSLLASTPQGTLSPNISNSNKVSDLDKHDKQRTDDTKNSNSVTSTPTQKPSTVEVLWWSSEDYQTNQGRYEVVYDPGFTVSLNDNGGISWSDLYQHSPNAKPWAAPLYWIGKDWQWSGDRFIRPFDGVLLNSFGGGPTGISTWDSPGQQRPEIYAMRGDLELIKLTGKTTEVHYYSGWVDDNSLTPYLTVIPYQKHQETQDNPLKEISKKLE